MMAAMVPAPMGDDPTPADPWLRDLYRSEYRGLVRLAALLVDDVGLAEEVVQDAFITCARSGDGPRLRDAGAAPAYLRRAVLNRSRSQLRSRRVRRRHLRAAGPPPTAPPADLPVVADDEHRRMLAALDELSDRQREVLVLRYYAELSEAEIADALDISPGSVKTHAHRGLAALAERLERA
jgi:RNA polymerase sigma-70 factor (sigma-E family)